MKYLFKRRFDCLINSHHQAKIQIQTMRQKGKGYSQDANELKYKNTAIKSRGKLKVKIIVQQVRVNGIYVAQELRWTTWITSTKRLRSYLDMVVPNRNHSNGKFSI